MVDSGDVQVEIVIPIEYLFRGVLSLNSYFLLVRKFSFALVLGGKLVISECMVSLLCTGTHVQDGGENCRS